MLVKESAVSGFLIVSRDSAVLRPCWAVAESLGWHTTVAASAWQLMDQLQPADAARVLVLDLAPGENSSLPVLRWLRCTHPTLPVVVIVRAGGRFSREEILRLGVRDCLAFPLCPIQLESSVRKILEGRRGPAESSGQGAESLDDGSSFLAPSAGISRLPAPLASLAEADHPLLMVDQPGSGKETLSAVETASSAPPAPIFGFKSLRALIRSVKSQTEKSAIAMALERTQWNRKAAARMLRVSYRTLLYKIEQYQLRPSDPSLLALSDRIRSAKRASRAGLRLESNQKAR